MSSKKSVLLTLALLLVAAIFGYARVPDQPFMQKARANLQGARAELQAAEHNKGGHRAKAIQYVNSAIAEVNQGIRYDRRRNHAQTESDVFGGPALPDQPHMRAALSNLQNAKRNLEQATTDKGGHRVRALDFVNKAIDEVNRGIAAGA